MHLLSVFLKIIFWGVLHLARNTGRGWNFLSLGSDPSILQSLPLSLGLSEGHPEHPPSPFSFTLQSKRGRTRTLPSASVLAVAAVASLEALSSSNDMMFFTKHAMAPSMLVLSWRERTEMKYWCTGVHPSWPSFRNKKRC